MNTENIETKVTNNLKFCIDTLAKALNVPIPDSVRPAVKIVKDNGDNYNSDHNEICVNETSIENGITYFEEAAHYIRTLLMLRHSKSKTSIDQPVQEFFGRLGESMGRELVKDTEYEFLFSNREPRTYANLDYFEREANTVAELAQKAACGEVYFALETFENAKKICLSITGFARKMLSAFSNYEKNANLSALGTELHDSVKHYIAELDAVNEKDVCGDEEPQKLIDEFSQYVHDIYIGTSNMASAANPEWFSSVLLTTSIFSLSQSSL